MRFAPVVVLGPILGGATEWVQWFSRRCAVSCKRWLVVEPDWCLRCDAIVRDNLELSVRAPIVPLFRRQLAYEAMLSDASAIVYVVSVIRDRARDNDRDFDAFASARLKVAPAAPILTLLNDVHCGRWAGPSPSPFTEQEAVRWLIPGTELRRTSIGYYGATGPCEVGAEESLAELTDLIDASSLHGTG